MDTNRADLGKAKASLEQTNKDRDAEKMRVREAAISAAELEVRQKGIL